MTALVLIVSLLVGTFMAEIVSRALGGQWLRGQLKQFGNFLQTFRETDGDDARQALLLRSGGATLQFSLGVLVLLVGLAAIAGLAPWVLKWTESQLTVYFVASSVVATAWWILRRPRHSPVSPGCSQAASCPSDHAK